MLILEGIVESMISASTCPILNNHIIRNGKLSIPLPLLEHLCPPPPPLTGQGAGRAQMPTWACPQICPPYQNDMSWDKTPGPPFDVCLRAG